MPAIQLPHETYDQWRTALLNLAAQGQGVDFDGYYGYQCVDLASELWWLYGQTFTLGGGIYAYQSWTNENARNQNGSGNFSIIYNLSDIKRGDMLIWNTGSFGQVAGHNGFADQDYSSGMTSMNILGQNQVNPSATVGHVPTVTNLSLSGVLGAFRNNSWQGSTPTPTPGGATLPRPYTKIVILHKRLQKRNHNV